MLKLEKGLFLFVVKPRWGQLYYFTMSREEYWRAWHETTYYEGNQTLQRCRLSSFRPGNKASPHQPVLHNSATSHFHFMCKNLAKDAQATEGLLHTF